MGLLDKVGGFLGGPIGGFLGDVVGGIASAGQARRQRSWEERMYENAVSKRVADLKRAGINPMLAAGMGLGGNIPGGAVASIPPARGASAGLAASSAASVRKQEVALLQSQTRKTEAERDKAMADAELSRAMAPYYGASAEHQTASAGAAKASAESLTRGLGEIDARIKNLESEVRRRDLDSELAQRVIDTMVELRQVQLELDRLKVPVSSAAAAGARMVERGLGETEKGAKAAGERAAALKLRLDALMDKVKRFSKGWEKQ